MKKQKKSTPANQTTTESKQPESAAWDENRPGEDRGLEGSDMPGGQPFVRRDQEPSTAPKKRLGFNLTENGNIDWSSLQSKTKDELIKVLKTDPEVKKVAGLDFLQEEFPFEFTQEDASLVLNVLNSVNAFSTRFFFGKFKKFNLDEDVCAAAFRIPPDDHAVLAKRGAKLANKYSGEWLRRHAELVMFFGMYFKCVTQQTITAVTMQVARNEAIQNRGKVNGQAQQPPSQESIL